MAQPSCSLSSFAYSDSPAAWQSCLFHPPPCGCSPPSSATLATEMSPWGPPYAANLCKVSGVLVSWERETRSVQSALHPGLLAFFFNTWRCALASDGSCSFPALCNVIRSSLVRPLSTRTMVDRCPLFAHQSSGTISWSYDFCPRANPKVYPTWDGAHDPSR